MTTKRQGFAGKTAVPVERSKVAIERLVARYGAREYGTMNSDATGLAIVQFTLGGGRAVEGPAWPIRITLPLPKLDDYAIALVRGSQKRRNPDQQRKAWEQACRARWRALLAVIQAKLLLIEIGGSTVEQAFFGDLLLPGTGVALHVAFKEPLAQIRTTGRLPGFLLPAAGAGEVHDAEFEGA